MPKHTTLDTPTTAPAQEATGRRVRIARADFLKALVEVAGDQTTPLTYHQYRARRDPKRHPSPNSINRRFTAWNLALAEAGLPHRVDKRTGEPLYRPYTPDELLKPTRKHVGEALREVAQQLGRPLTQDLYADNYDRGRHPSPTTVVHTCGTWSGALAVANLSPAPRGSRPTFDKSACRAAIRKALRQTPGATYLSAPAYDRLRNKDRDPSSATIRTHYGRSWPAAVADALTTAATNTNA